MIIKTYEIYCTNSEEVEIAIRAFLKEVILEGHYLSHYIKKPINVDTEMEALCYQVDLWTKAEKPFNRAETLQAERELYVKSNSIIELEFELL